MSDAVSAFLEHFAAGRGTFRTPLPAETPYEEMVRKYEAGDPDMLQVMKLTVQLPFSAATAEQELVLWKQRAADERRELRAQVPVHHTVSAATGDLQALEGKIAGVSPDLLALYQHLHSAQLYVDEANPEGGVLFYPASAMDDEHSYLLDWLDDGDEGFEESTVDGRLEVVGTPPWIANALVFAGVGQSAERFLLACERSHQGSVFLFDHDGMSFRRIAPSMAQFLALLRTQPLTVAPWIGIHDAQAYDHGL